MRILKWWKNVGLPKLQGATFALVPLQEVTDEQTGFDHILAAVRASDCDFCLVEQHELVADYRESKP